MLLYCEPDDLELWLTPDEIADNELKLPRFIRTASSMVRFETRGARYSVDSSGKPSDEELVEAFRDATCAQVAFWVTTKTDPGVGGIHSGAPRVQSKSMGDRSVTYATPSSVEEELKVIAASELCKESRMILQVHNLLSTQPL